MLGISKGHESNDRVTSAQADVRRLLRDENASQPEAASSISSGLSIVGKIVGHGALTIFGRVQGEVRASTVVIAEGAEMLGDVDRGECSVRGDVPPKRKSDRFSVASSN